jgi:DNA-binding GntR family transcriptional regulator
LHVPILDALRRRDVDAVVTALERHFEEVSANMAERLPDDDDGTDR